MLFVRGCRAAPPTAPGVRGRRRRASRWVFMVPALNEEVTIADSVERLLSIPVARPPRRGDRRRLGRPHARDPRRDRPPRPASSSGASCPRPASARRRGSTTPTSCSPSGSAPSHRTQVIVVIVDADGRLAPDAPAHVATHFADPTRRRRPVAGSDLQPAARPGLVAGRRVRRVRPPVSRPGRNGWGTAGMGGNGQFNRLSALDDVADDVGPWRDRLTEDQDLGLRLIGAAGRVARSCARPSISRACRSCGRCCVSAPAGRRETCRRCASCGELRHAPFTVPARLELMAYLFMPLWQGIIGLTFLVAIALAVFDIAPFWVGGDLEQLCSSTCSPSAARSWAASRAPLAGAGGLADRLPDRQRVHVLHLASVAGAAALDGAPDHQARQLGQDRARARELHATAGPAPSPV